jgi:very-short-patch-repair endonuclease
MTSIPALPFALRQRPFRVREALRRGVSAGVLRSRVLQRPFHGIRCWKVPTTHDELARAVLPRLRGDQAFSHTTAAAMLGIPLPRRLERDRRVHVTTIGTDQALRIRGTVGHRSRADRLVVVHSGTAALTSPADTFVALARMLSLDELIVAGDALIGWLGWCDLGDLHSAIRRHRGARGIRKARAALAEVRSGSRSPGETRLRLALTRRGLPEPERNHNVVVDGRWIACVDLAYPTARLAIEYESDLHRTDPSAFRKDLSRGERLKDVEWWLIRATADDVGRTVEQFVARVRRLLHVGTTGSHDPRHRAVRGPTR